jgi:hypothetical protein
MKCVQIICVLMPILFVTTTYATARDYSVAKAVSKQHRVRDRGVARRHCEAGGRCWRHNRDAHRDRGNHIADFFERGGRRGLRKCQRLIRTVGEGAATVGGAQRNAEKVWMETVTFDYGQAYADPSTAQNIDWLCSRSSVRSVLGATLHKCALRATPCRPDVTHGRGNVKDDEDEAPRERR